MRNRARRTLLDGLLRRSYERRVMNHRLHLPMISAQARAILDAVETEGVHLTSVHSLGLPGTERLLHSATSLLPMLERSPARQPSSFSVHLDEAYLSEFPELYLWGLNDNLLDMAENYLGVPVGYHGVNLTRSIVNDQHYGTRMWHLDPQDHRLFRIIIYLSEVDRDSGPFQYIPRQQSGTVRRALRYANENVPDSIMRQVAEPDHWNACVGPQGTAIFTDPANVFHRGKAPKCRERFAIFYSYHSAKPAHGCYLQPSLSTDVLANIADKLTERQRACVYWRS